MYVDEASLVVKCTSDLPTRELQMGLKTTDQHVSWTVVKSVTMGIIYRIIRYSEYTGLHIISINQQGDTGASFYFKNFPTMLYICNVRIYNELALFTPIHDLFQLPMHEK